MFIYFCLFVSWLKSILSFDFHFTNTNCCFVIDFISLLDSVISPISLKTWMKKFRILPFHCTYFYLPFISLPLHKFKYFSFLFLQLFPISNTVAYFHFILHVFCSALNFSCFFPEGSFHNVSFLFVFFLLLLIHSWQKSFMA